MNARLLLILLMLSSTMSGCISEELGESVQEITPTDEIQDEESQFSVHCIE